MDRLLFTTAFVLATAPPAFAQCRLCAPESTVVTQAHSIPLGIRVEATLDLGRAAQTRPGGGGSITLDAQTGARRVSGSLADLGGMALKGVVRLEGEPFAPVVVTLPPRIELRALDGSTAEIVELRSDLPPGAVLDAQGALSFRFGGRLIVTGGQAGDFRGRIPVVAEYR